MSFPTHRPRRLRQNSTIRSMVRETKLTPEDLIAGMFVVPGQGVRKPISSLPGVEQVSPDIAVEEAYQLQKLGVKGVMMFGIPDHKDEIGAVSYEENGVVQQAIRAIKKDVKDIQLIADLCFCEYTTHGHCGVLVDGKLDNDLTLVETAKQCVSLAQAGADMIAPSGMIDGMVGTIRQALDENSFTSLPIMSYSVKYASAFYGPFRDAVECSLQSGDRCSHQMDPANAEEAFREVELDLEEGADILMVKPALAYLDIIRRIKDNFPVPLAAYNVSGEYAMIKFAAEKGLIDGERVMLETLTSIKRAGADMIITYFAKDAAALLHR